MTSPPRGGLWPAVFFDRDGVINEDSGYVGDLSRFAFLPGAIAAVRAVNRRPALAFLVTNQSGVARGFFTEADVLAVHDGMVRAMAFQGAHFEDIRYCPHLPDAPVAAFRQNCACRKPQPGMILDLMAKWPVDPARSVLIGDKPSDVEAAWAAGIRGVLLKREPLERVVETILDRIA